MVGRAALGDPWIFSGARVSAAEAARFLLDYAAALLASGTSRQAGAAGRLKQLLQHWTAGELVDGERRGWMRERGLEHLLARLQAIAGGARDPISYPATDAVASAR